MKQDKSVFPSFYPVKTFLNIKTKCNVSNIYVLRKNKNCFRFMFMKNIINCLFYFYFIFGAKAPHMV